MEYKIVVLGGGGVGKSALTIQFIMKKFVSEYDPTIEDQYRMQTTIDDKTCYLDILDTAGQEEFSAMQDQYILSGDGFLLVYAVDSKPSFDEIRKLRDRILTVKEKDKVPIVICANKRDLSMNYHHVSSQEGRDMAKSFGCPLLETSAKERFNVVEAFHTLVREIRKEKEPIEKPKKRCIFF
ncbi:Ras1 [Monocercomonoides exilis]|uniref:Ras1 n=1 Tax=Monocercomonoides exilis TaxID=2049356 RepID=UPI003559CADE|nr:Ras1 [Monocercomonoides exilis]|eukprot:MONOS_9009.1-p1 / transcript=MONOS_9009.1 / gene=MONOS_9009 / organism=Monocercomonoides_exilis_PA203 / gene_product=Ras1 / transcript_product=Ras1 / location=Mono_scaffold00357:27263-28249(-) / protein_length=182 / sequence_SO=supercontig / SO=protein_coding / is_pseudo=false